MKRLLFKHILRAKYMVDGAFFWSWKSAMAEANNSIGKTTVWSMDYSPLYTKRGVFHAVHPDATNGQGW
jgi:hypothetical protein